MGSCQPQINANKVVLLLSVVPLASSGEPEDEYENDDEDDFHRTQPV